MYEDRERPVGYLQHVRHPTVGETAFQPGQHDAVLGVDHDGDGDIARQLSHASIVQKRPADSPPGDESNRGGTKRIRVDLTVPGIGDGHIELTTVPIGGVDESPDVDPVAHQVDV